MKTQKILVSTCIGLALLFYGMTASAALMGTAFTYQGRLMDNDTPAEGIYEMEFKLFDSIADPNQLGSTISFRSVEVTDGYFTVALDFGSSVFDGDARWLEIGVRSSENPSDPFTTLIPRQEITASPYTLYSLQTHGIFVDDLLNVGVGTQSPAGKLHVDGGKAMSGDGGADLVLKAQDGGDGWALQYDGAPGGDIILLPGEGGDEIESGSPGPDGNVGIGTITPTTKLDVVGTVTATAFAGDGSNLSGIVIDSGWTISGNDMYSSPSGNVGIGTTSPGTKLHIEGGSDASLGGGGFLMTGSESGTNVLIDDNEIIARDNGSSSRLYLNKGSGNVVVSVLEITGGSDLAEPFEVAGAESIEPGMVVAIDSKHPGQLRVADKAYDRTVAGIVSGANGINPGMTMTQKGTVTEGSFLVALTGRVYVRADASNGCIEPGDLLTTSQTPGHAMKVTDYSKAQGAILGKAMSSLDHGRGLVLVLVTLQ